MAIQVLSDFSAALTEELGGNVISQFNRLSVMLSIMRLTDGKGRNCAWDAQFTGAAAETFTEGADVSNYTQDIEVPATLSWGQYRHNFAISGLGQAVAGSSTNSPQEYQDLVGERASTGAQVLASKLDTDCFSGSGANAIIGLNTAVGATGTYANISRSTYTEWKGNVISNSGVARDLAKWQLDALESAIFDACGMPPNVIVCSSACARKYEGMFDSQTRVLLNARDLAIGAQANNLGAMAIDVGGFTGLSYKGMPVFRARNCQAGRIYMLNTTMMELQTVPFGKRNTSGKVDKIQLTTGGAQAKQLGLNVAIEALAKTGDADKYTVKLYPQLKVIRPNANGWLDDVSEVG